MIFKIGRVTMRKFVNTAFIIVFFVTLLWSPVMMLINGVMPVFLLLAELLDERQRQA